jgi:hypothetical protein
MGLERIKKRTQLKLKNELHNKICACEYKRCTYRQSARLPHAMPNAALTMIARSNIGTSTAIAIIIAFRTTNAKQQSTLILSAPAIATERKTIATISLKS